MMEWLAQGTATMQQLASILDQVPLGIALIGLDRRIAFINRALETLTGFSRQLVTGLPCAAVLRSSACLGQCPIARILDSAKPVSCDCDIINCEREKIPVHATVAPLLDGLGAPLGFLESLDDLRFGVRQVGASGPGLAFSQVVGRSPEMTRIFETLPFIAQTDSSLLVTGETGTGKDIIAEGIHNASRRAKGPFIKVNCGALPETLLESELFGHRKGAFTGAMENKPGRIQLGHNGTLFLTEIGDLPLPLQVKLLSFLDDKVIYPLGDTKGYAADVRIIAATHHHLEDMVRRGTFRRDLLFRLNVIRIHLPPLRERGEDKTILRNHFLRIFSTQMGKRIKDFSKPAQLILAQYAYPGNVRELKNIVEYSCALCRGSEIDPVDLPPYLLEGDAIGLIPAPMSRDTAAPLPSSSGYASIAALERDRIMAALDRAGGKRSLAASALGWGRTTLWRKIKLYGLDAKE